MSDLHIEPAALPYYERQDVGLALQAVRETVDEWSYEADPHGYCHQRADLVAVLQRLDDLEAIVRDLAGADDPVVDIDPEVMGDYVCMVCPETDDDSPGVVHVREDFVHAESCAWRRAVEWVERNSHD